MGYHVINSRDNVKVNLKNGHKYALRDIKNGEEIIKYGFPIGISTEDIDENAHVHSHNLKTLLSGLKDYAYKPNFQKLNTENLAFELGAGETEIQKLTVSKECEIEGGAGKLSILGGTINDLCLDLGVGEVNLITNLTGKKHYYQDIEITTI